VELDAKLLVNCSTGGDKLALYNDFKKFCPAMLGVQQPALLTGIPKCSLSISISFMLYSQTLSWSEKKETNKQKINQPCCKEAWWCIGN